MNGYRQPPGSPEPLYALYSVVDKLEEQVRKRSPISKFYTRLIKLDVIPVMFIPRTMLLLLKRCAYMK